MSSVAAPAFQQPDFADWLSPILVKELRQGLKSRAFVSAFIIVQVVMIVLVGMQLLAATDAFGRSGSDVFTGMFWAVVLVPLLVFMPARGLAAVSEEAKSNTFDLVQLTHLTAFRIVTGKWIALVAQTLLLVTAVLPYAVLRYYFGAVDVVTDLQVIAAMLTLSLVLTAGAIALSTAALAVRILVLVILVPMTTTVFGAFSFARSFGGPFSTTGPGTWWWVPYAMACVYIVTFLEAAAAKLAPLCENHSARKRFIVLLLAVASTVLAWFSEDAGSTMMIMFAPLLLWITVEALTEVPSAVPALYAPFARRGFPGRLAGRVLYPGWSTAVIFSGILLLLVYAFSEMMFRRHSAGSPGDAYRIAFWPLFYFALLSPLPVMFLLPRVKQRFWLYVLIQLVFFIFFWATAISSDSRFSSSSADDYRWLGVFPTSALCGLMSHSSSAELAAHYLRLSGAVGLVLLGFLALLIRRDFRFMSYLERTAVAALKKS